MDVEIRVDRTRCIGSGQCVFVAPRAFDQDSDAKAVVTDPRGEPEERILHAVTACPVQAIALHIGGTVVAADDLKDWAHGARSDHPIVPVLEQLGEDHHELQTALSATGPADGPERVDEISSLARAHLRLEGEAYAAITALVDPQLVDAFEANHRVIDEALDELAAHGADPVRRGRAMSRLATAVGDHIRLEETVLFPIALATLARRQSSGRAALTGDQALTPRVGAGSQAADAPGDRTATRKSESSVNGRRSHDESSSSAVRPTAATSSKNSTKA
jgi:ferredoxin